jgi:hypothetical protein
MVNWFSPRYSTEDLRIIADAVQFTKDSHRTFLQNKYSGASQLTREIIDNERGDSDIELNKLLELIIDNPHGTMWDDSERIHFFSKLGSALNLYLLHLDEEISMFDLPQLKSKRKNISSMLEVDIYQGLDTHLYDEYYIIKQETIPNLLFFSYNINDKKIVGKISEILESKYGYTVFRAHDTIPSGKIWRDTLKENLTKCEGLIAYVTENFLPSFYAHQECGWVMGQKRPIFPLFLTDKKPGLLEEWQGKPIDGPPDPDYLAELINDAFKKPQ